MLSKDLRNAWVSSIVHHTKERVIGGLFVAVLNTSQLVVNTGAVIAARLDGEKHYDIIRSWIFYYQLPKVRLITFTLSLTCKAPRRK